MTNWLNLKMKCMPVNRKVFNLNKNSKNAQKTNGKYDTTDKNAKEY